MAAQAFLEIRPVLTEHATRYPEWGAADLYKLLHQAASGSEHALGEAAEVRRRLLLELADCGNGPPEPLIDPISPDGRIVRVHLRPFLRLGLDPEALLRAFLDTAHGFRPDADRLPVDVAAAQELARSGVIGIPFDEVERQLAAMQALGFPAVNHSAHYARTYRPAYRVVLRELLADEIASAG